jgi:hypothetical protein
MTFSRNKAERTQREVAGIEEDPHGVDHLFPHGFWYAANRVDIVDDGATLLAALLSLDNPHLRLVTAGDSMLKRFLQLEDAPVEKIRDFVMDFGPLYICEHDMPNSHNRVRKSLPRDSSEHVCDPLTRDGYFEEPVHVWRHISGRAKALLALGAELHQNRPAKAEHWNRLPYRHDEGEEWFVEPSGKIHLDKRLLALELNGWMEGGGVTPVLDWETPGAPLLRFRPEGLFGAIGLQLATRLGRIAPTAVCSACGTYYERLGRAPKRGQHNYCPRCKTTGPSKMYKRTRQPSTGDRYN